MLPRRLLGFASNVGKAIPSGLTGKKRLGSVLSDALPAQCERSEMPLCSMPFERLRQTKRHVLAAGKKNRIRNSTKGRILQTA
jgi:hypothetical protein